MKCKHFAILMRRPDKSMRFPIILAFLQLFSREPSNHPVSSGTIEVNNTKSDPIDVLLFGGAPYTEPIVAEGPFVMNTTAEVIDAYRDFYAGKYGRIEAKIGGA